MNKQVAKIEKRSRRQVRIRSKVSGTADRPRLSVFKSNKFIYAQIIDDEKAATLVAVSSAAIKSGTEIEKAQAVGKEIAKLASGKGIKKVVFDRGGYVYTGKIQALANGAREGGLIF
jgi:large subunit ribosomal protein L18